MNARWPRNKDAVLLFVGVMLAASFGRNLATLLHWPVLAPAASMAAGLGYFAFACFFKENWLRAALLTAVAFLVGLSVTYARLRIWRT
jgi:hypothetical protein